MRNLDKTILALLIILLVLTVSTIYVYTNKILYPKLNNEALAKEYEEELSRTKEEIVTVSEKKEAEDVKLSYKSMSETDRVHKYFMEYINNVDLGNYEKAYSYLYPEFKENYFADYATFENYVKTTYPEYMIIQYDDISMQGKYYILTVVIYDAISQGEVTNARLQNFIIYENDFGDFSISFQI